MAARFTTLLFSLLTFLWADSRVSAQEILQASHHGGFFTEAFDLSFHPVPEGAEVRYTLNGSEPGPESARFDGPIRIQSRAGEPNNLSMIDRTTHAYATWAPPAGEVFKATVVRAAIFAGSERVSDVVTHTYFVDPENHGRYGVAVISLVTDSLHLFDHETGICVLGRIYDEWRAANPNAATTGGTPANYHGRGQEWERPVHIEFFEPDGTLGFSQDAGARMHGSWARAFRQKSFRLYSRSDYGESRFRYRIFPNNPLDDFNRLLLRNSGQDWTKTMMRDAMMQRLVEHLDVDTQAYRPAVVFINGEYWGVHNIRERYDRHYLETNYGVDRDRVDILELNASVKEGGAGHYAAMLDFIQQTGLQSEAHLNELNTMMDVANFRDYNIAQIYFNNLDWPHNNINYWRYQAGAFDPAAPYGHDGRWRWMIFDTDFGFGWTRVWDAERFNAMQWALSPGGNGRGGWATFILRSLVSNQAFRNDFASRFADLLNTAFREERVLNEIESMKSVLEPHMQEHLDRWGYHDDRWETPRNLQDWEANLDVLRNFARERPTHLRRHVADQFNLGRRFDLVVNASDPRGGYIEVNSIALRPGTPGIGAEVYPWIGKYFEHVPVQVVARPAPGYRFAGWEGVTGASGDTVTISLNGHRAITALFEAESGPVDAVPQPHALLSGPYEFSEWSPAAEPGTYPPNMAFFYMDEQEPSLEAQPAGLASGAYNLESRTRIVGLEGEGFGFINTSHEDGNPGFPGRRLGASVLGLDTRGMEAVEVTWTGGTVIPNSRVYNIRLQYRLYDSGPLADVLDELGRPVEYEWNELAGHAETIGPVRLPAEVEDRPYVQLWWRYYFTGERVDDESGARAMLRVGDITVSALRSVAAEAEMPPGDFLLEQNYPNPFTQVTAIRFSVAKPGPVTLRVYTADGRLVHSLVERELPAGTHEAIFDADRLASGTYFYVLRQGGRVQVRPMVLLNS